MSTRPALVAARIALVALVAGGLLLAIADPFTAFFYISYAAMGGLLAWRRPREVIGWLLICIGFGFIGTTTSPNVDAAALAAGTASTADFLAVWAGSWAGYLTFGGFVALTVLFPTGRLPQGRWRWPAAALITGAIAVAVLAATAPSLSFNPDGGVTSISVPNRLAVLPELPLWSAFPPDLLILPTVAMLAIGVVAMLVRYRRARGLLRLQLRWLVASLLFMVLAIVGGLSTLYVFGAEIGGAAWLGAIVAYPTIPLAIYIAVTRYRLYEIDRIVSRAISWFVLTVILAGLFAAAIVGLQAVLAPVTDNNTLAVAASTLLAAALFQPLRRSIQAVVDHRFNRRRYDAERIVTGFAERLRDETDLAEIHRDVVAAAGTSLQPASLAIWVRQTNR
jgi:hypothetical protein